MIHFSTDYVFDGEKTEAYTEDDSTNPISVYGKSKLKGEEKIVNTLSKYFIFRLAWLYGLHGTPFVYTMLRLLNEKREINVVKDQWGSPTYTKDVADFIIRIISNDSNKYSIYNFTNEGRTNWYEFTIEIYSLAKKYHLIDKPVKINAIGTKDYPTKAKRPMNSYMSKEKIKKTFKIDIRSWQEALEEYIISKKEL